MFLFTHPGVFIHTSSQAYYELPVTLLTLPVTLVTPRRPIMKEYKFTPSSKMLTISEGLEVEVELSAERIAYRLVSYLVS